MVLLKRLRIQKLFTFGFLVLIIFFLGIILGGNLRSSDLSEINDIIANSELDTESYIIEQQLIGSLDYEKCDLAKIRFNQISPELGDLGRKLEELEKNEIVGETEYKFLKRKYHLLQIRTYLLVKNYLKSCNDTTMNVVLYYYDKSNYSINQGLILDNIVLDYDINVFAIEAGYSHELSFLENFYGVSKNNLPSLIINDNVHLKGLSSYDLVVSNLKIKFENRSTKLLEHNISKDSFDVFNSSDNLINNS